MLVALGVLWTVLRPGVWQTDYTVSDSGPLAYVRVFALRIDPAQVEFTLQSATRDYGLRPAWTIDSLPATGIVALNAGQFRGPAAWGWLVRNGIETQAPGSGTLAMAFVVDSAGTPSLVTPEEIPAIRKRAFTAFQSYPALLIDDGKAPWELQAEGRGVDLKHRDSRLAICTSKDGSVIVALTRFASLGRKAETIPFGPTVPEMVTLMRSLGCQRAMLLDGGLSSQLAVRNAKGELTRWTNWRPVPLGIVVKPR
jgi:exopolysaccharide biosynthesis protein